VRWKRALVLQAVSLDQVAAYMLEHGGRPDELVNR